MSAIPHSPFDHGRDPVTLAERHQRSLISLNIQW
jgi:hypothetical protein